MERLGYEKNKVFLAEKAGCDHMIFSSGDPYGQEEVNGE
jgi:hypothetical protein